MPRPGSYLNHLPLIGLLVASGLLLVLSIQHNRLERDYRNLAERNRFLTPGTYIPLTQATSLAGDPVALGASGRSEILIYLTTSCPYCAASVPAWRELSRRASRANGIEVFIVSMDSAPATSDYLRRNDLGNLTTVLFLEPRLRTLFRSYSVPQTLVVRDGRVVYARRQVFSTGAADSVLALLDAIRSTQVIGRN